MAFEELAPPVKRAPTKADVRIGMSVMGRGDAVTPKLTVVLREHVLDLLGGKSRRYRVAIGTTEDAHWLRIVQADDGSFEAQELGIAKGGGVFRIRTGAHDRLPACIIPLQETNYRHDKVGKCLLVGLPSWAWDARRKKELEAEHTKRSAPR